ncbi:MAG TPA: class I mannose-6-phosphate isomerase [bacterium]|nr:class I mannose-6-phosphate isomerase [bacterium]
MDKELLIPYPLLFEPILKEKVWGGQKLKTLFGRQVPPGKKIGESWELSGFGNDSSRVANGPYKGRQLNELIKTFGKPFAGYEIFQRFSDKFPLLYKLIDAAEPFSVQVHPTDSFAVEFEDGSWGKTELWYILDASPGAKIISGLKEWVDEETLVSAIADGTVEKCLEEIDIKPGDAYYVPAGRVHGTKGSVVFFEIQESSDLSYRIFDWQRSRQRELHIDKALTVINYDDIDETVLNPIVVREGDVEERLVLACDHFTIEKLILRSPCADQCRGEKFFVLFVIAGSGSIVYGRDMKEAVPVKKGDFVYLPAALGSYKLAPDQGRLEILKTFVT